MFSLSRMQCNSAHKPVNTINIRNHTFFNASRLLENVCTKESSLKLTVYVKKINRQIPIFYLKRQKSHSYQIRKISRIS